MDECRYCKDVDRVEAFRNPYTKEIHPTCAACRLSFTAYHSEISFLTKCSFLFLPLLLLISFVWIFFNWKVGLSATAILFVAEIVSIKLQGYLIKQREIKCGTYVDTKALVWCKTCRHFRKDKGYSDSINGAWRSETLPKPELLPCKIADKSLDTWKAYFMLEMGKRTLYPNNCSQWEKK